MHNKYYLSNYSLQTRRFIYTDDNNISNICTNVNCCTQCVGDARQLCMRVQASLTANCICKNFMVIDEISHARFWNLVYSRQEIMLLAMRANRLISLLLLYLNNSWFHVNCSHLILTVASRFSKTDIYILGRQIILFYDGIGGTSGF